MLQKAATVFGVVFTLVGVLGFIPGITTTDEHGMGMLLGIFAVDSMHNIVHIASGVLALAAAIFDKYARLYFQVFGAVYALVVVIGLIQGDTVLGLIHTNMADHILHVVLAISMLAIGFGLKDKPTAMPPAAPTNSAL